MKSRLAFLLLVISLAGCAASVAPARQASVDVDPRIAAAEQELARAEVELHQQKAAAAVDCPRACDLTATICKLAERICEMAEQDSTANVRARCQDARQRCARAQRDTAVVCSCAADRPR